MKREKGKGIQHDGEVQFKIDQGNLHWEWYLSKSELCRYLSDKSQDVKTANEKDFEGAYTWWFQGAAGVE